MKNRLILAHLLIAISLVGCGRSEDATRNDAVSELLKEKMEAAHKDKEQVAKRGRTSTRLKPLAYDAETGTYVEQK